MEFDNILRFGCKIEFTRKRIHVFNINGVHLAVANKS